MPRNRPQVPALVHHKPTGQARVRIAGRDFYLGRFGTPEAEEAYRRLVAEWLTTGTLPAPRSAPTSPVLSVNELLLRYWRHVEGYYVKDGRPTSEQRMIRDSLRVVKELYGTTPAADFGPLKLKTVRDAMIGKGWCRTEVNKKVGRVRRCFRWAVENELIPPSVSHGLQAVSGLRKGRTEAREAAPVLPVDVETVNRTLPHLSRILGDMVRVQLLTGCRPGEVCLLRPCDVNCDADVWEYVPASHKTEHHGRQRIIFIGPKAQAILVRYLDNRPADAYCFSPRESMQEYRERRRAERKTPENHGNRPGSNRKADPRKQPGERYTNLVYGRAVATACRKAGIKPHWSPNQLRHARATDIRRQYGIEAAQVTLGHADALLTAEVYAERDFATARRVMAEVG